MAENSFPYKYLLMKHYGRFMSVFIKILVSVEYFSGFKTELLALIYIKAPFLICKKINVKDYFTLM